jgi:hypothetical protein
MSLPVNVCLAKGDLGERNTGLQLLRDLADLQKKINEDIVLCLRNLLEIV